MRKVFRTTVELPLEDYIKVVLLVAEGKYPNVKVAVNDAISKMLESYPEEYFNELKEKYSDVVERIENAKSVRERTAVRRWSV